MLFQVCSGTLINPLVTPLGKLEGDLEVLGTQVPTQVVRCEQITQPTLRQIRSVAWFRLSFSFQFVSTNPGGRSYAHFTKKLRLRGVRALGSAYQT